MADPIGTPTVSEPFSLASGESTAGYPIWFPFNITVAGTWTGTWWVEVSADGSNWANCTIGGLPASFSTNGFFVAPNVFQKGLVYRVTRGVGTGTLTGIISGQDPS